MPATIPIPATIDSPGETSALVPDNDTGEVVITVDVGSVAGTNSPTLTLTATPALPAASHGPDYPVTEWDDGSAVTAEITAAGVHTLTLPPSLAPDGTPGRYYKLSWALAGTSPQFSITSTTAEG